MRKIRKLFLSLILMFVCVIGLTYNARAEDAVPEEEFEENYRIDVIAETGSAGSGLSMSLEGFDKAKAKEKGYWYYIKFVKDVSEKPVLSENLEELDEDSDEIFGSYYNVIITHNEEKDIYDTSIYIKSDWYMVDGYTNAYIVRCARNEELEKECEVLDEPVTVEKPSLPSLSQRYEYFLFSDEKELSVFPLFPHLGDIGSHELNVKIGIINDTQLLKKISKNEAGSYESLISYAKVNDGRVYSFNDKNNYKIDTSVFEVVNGNYYYIYTYYTNTDGLYRDLGDVTVAMADHDVLHNDVVWNFDESVWDKFVEEFKNTDLVKLYDDSEAQLEITSTENSLSVILTDGNNTYTTNFSYENGILKYEPTSDEDELIFVDNVWQMNAIYALSELKGYDIDKVSKWLEESEDKVLTIKNDGIEYESKDYSYKEETDGVSTTIDATILTSFELDIQNGLKSYNEDKISDYKFIFGENQKYKVGETKELKFEIDAEYELFESVYVNGKLLDSSSYTVSDGSTVVVLKKEYLDTLNNGVHTLKVTFKDGGYAETQFTIEKTVKNPSTGIGITSGILVLALVFVGIYVLIRKQSKFPKHN